MPRFLVLAACLLLADPLHGADFPVKITAVRTGLPALDRTDNRAAIVKFACWAPVYIDLETTGNIGEAAELVIESPDPDEILTTLASPLALPESGGRLTGMLSYVRPAAGGEITVMVRTRDGGRPLSEPFRIRSLLPLDPVSYVVLTLGQPFPGFELPRPTGAGDEAPGLHGGRVHLANHNSFEQLPENWIGYDTADLVLLNTAPGSEEFWRQLFGEAGQKKRDALLEWVRRGGRMVVTVGASAGLVAELPALRDFLAFEVVADRHAGVLSITWPAREASQTSTLSGSLGQRNAEFPIARLRAKANQAVRAIIPLPDAAGPPAIIYAGQFAFGLGKVTVIGFDLDRPPFTTFSQRPEFWDWVLRDGGSSRASVGDGKPRPDSLGRVSEDEDEMAVALRTHSDTFPEVPVVSFGWVAVLIGFYILLIGPIEYFFLKRVLGRLELTWITFPLIVLTVSLAAYLTAYSLKGRVLKLNKIDVTDVDIASGRVYGTTWFTIFSPRTENYTLAITPGNGWGTPAPGSAVSWVGAARGGRASLMRRTYSYHSTDNAPAQAMEDVPVQVWSTKSFVANWSGQFDPNSATPPARSDLYHPAGDPSAVTGTFTLNLSVPVLSECVLFYAGQAFPVPGDTIRPGDVIRPVWEKPVLAPQWLQKEGGLEDVLRRVPAYADRPGAARTIVTQPTVPTTATATLAGSLPLWGLLFHEASLTYAEGVVPRNASSRRLDQSWRLHPQNRNEVILVGRAYAPSGSAAEEALSGPGAASQLWLRELPGSGERTPISPGSTGRQETWVRVYLPVK